MNPNPFYFGTSPRRLFGLFTPAHGAGGSARGIVLCHPWGSEYTYAYRSMRQLSVMLPSAGFNVLRFDYFGTGDSAGEMEQADLAGWADDIDSAVDELRDTTGARYVGLVGLRLGAALAVSAARRRNRDIASVVLWDPVVSGPAYLSELGCSMPKAGVVADDPGAWDAETNGLAEVGGFPLTQKLILQMSAIDVLSEIESLTCRTLVVTTQAGSSSTLSSLGLRAPFPERLTVEEVLSPPAWLEDRHSGAAVIPAKVLQRIAGWLR